MATVHTGRQPPQGERLEALIANHRAVGPGPVEKAATSLTGDSANGGRFPLQLLDRTHLGRREVEQFIAGRYAKAFGARLHHFYPSLLVYRETRGRILGAVGVRSALKQSLFIESYLARSIEHLIADHVGPVSRDQVVEVGNLAIASSLFAFPFISLIGAWVQLYEVEWIVFSLTDRLQRVFRTAGVRLIRLGESIEALAPPDGNHWGSYYERGPGVFAVGVRDGLATFRRFHARCAPSDSVPLHRLM